jgi:hypothetical protein
MAAESNAFPKRVPCQHLITVAYNEGDEDHAERLADSIYAASSCGYAGGTYPMPIQLLAIQGAWRSRASLPAVRRR